MMRNDFRMDRRVVGNGRKTSNFAFSVGLLFAISFTLLIWAAGVRLEDVPLRPDQGATWYYWKLAEPTIASQLTAWGGYLLHQFFLWGIIMYARKHVHTYTTSLHRINIVALLGNVAFVVLHFVQTHFWYDGLAQNVSLTSSEASVVLLLIVVLLMENRRRGLFGGKKVSIAKSIIDFFRQYHGFIFAWAIVYTFWFHPMVATSGHLLGFFYIFLLLLQSSLFYTRMHLNRWWTVLLELMVLFHGAVVVTMLRGSALWAFVLGFLGIFLITQMHGLRLKLWMRWGVFGLYLLTILIAFTQKGTAVWRDILLLPVLEYGLLFLLAGVTWLGIMIYQRVRPRQT